MTQWVNVVLGPMFPGNNVSWFIYLKETWLGNNVFILNKVNFAFVGSRRTYMKS